MLEKLIQSVDLSPALASRLAEDYERLSRGLPPRLEEYVLERYGLDLASEYGGIPVKNPFGKGSGQLSLNLFQFLPDSDSVLVFVVLNTIIA